LNQKPKIPEKQSLYFFDEESSYIRISIRYKNHIKKLNFGKGFVLFADKITISVVTGFTL